MPVTKRLCSVVQGVKEGVYERIERLWCRNARDTDEIEENTDSVIAQKPNKTRPPKPNNTQDDRRMFGTSATAWLTSNWVTYILTPLIIVVFVGGCIVFVVFMVKTKEEHDNFVREERRKDEAERIIQQPSTISNSGESLI